MKPASRAALLLAALVLPVAAVLASYVLTGGARVPRVPASVEVGSSPAPPPPNLQPRSSHLPPPPPDEDDEDDDPHHDHDHDD